MSGTKTHSIRGKMILFIGVPSTVIIVATVWWLLVFAERQATALNRQEITRHARTAAIQFEQYIGEAARLANSNARLFSRSPNLNDDQIYGILRGTLRDNIRIYGAATAFEPGFHKERKGLHSPYVFRSGRDEITEMNIDETVYDWYNDEKWTWWHLPKKAGKGVWTEPYFDEGAGNVLMSTYSTPFNRMGNFAGVTTVDINLEKLGNDIKAAFPDADEFYVINRDGDYIFSPDSSEILNANVFELLEAKGQGDLRPEVEAMLSGTHGSIALKGVIDSDIAVAAYAPIPSTGWTYLTLVAKSESLSNFHRRVTLVVIGFSLAILLMLATIIFMSGKVAHPIILLSQQAQRIAEGCFDLEVDRIRTGDEIQELASSFVSMQKQVQSREKQLLESRESTLLDLLESAPDAMLVADENGHICRLNEILLQIFDYTRDEVIGQKVDLLIPERVRETHGQHLNDYFADPHARQMGAGKELLGLKKDGSEFPIEIALSPFREPEGLRAVAAIRDITERKRNEEDLRKLNRAVEQGSAMVFITDAEGNIEYVNARFTEVTGYTSEQAIGENPRLLKSGTQDPSVYAELWKTLMDGGTWRGELCNRRSDGSLFWAYAALSPIRGNDGTITHFVAIEEDVTADKEAAEEIKRKEERFRTLLSNLPGTVYRCAHDKDWTMLFISERVEELTGYPAEEFLNNEVRTYDSVIHPDDSERVGIEVGEAIETNRPWTIQYRVIHQDGSIKWVGERGRGIFDEDGTVEYLDGVIIDITKEKEMESELTVAREQAEAANHAKSDFLSSMSHELRTPLNGVLGYAQILHRDKSVTPKQRENVESIINCGDHLLSLINDVLDLSKIEAGRLDLNIASCDLEKLIRSISDIVGERARTKGLLFDIKVSPEVPRGIMTDEGKLRQVLVNLLGNAVKFTEKGEVRLEVKEAVKGSLSFEVHDTGVGMDKQELEEIFDPFKQVEAGKAAGGTGLGLAISERLLTKMGGGIEVESKKGKGSCFRVTIPLTEVPREDFTASDFSDPNQVEEFRLAKGESAHVLVADDRQANRDILEQMLEEAGFAVTLADDGDTALEALQTGTFDIVLLDVRMPRLNGIDAVGQIRSNDKLKGLPVIAVTASVFPEFQDKAIKAGFDDFLPKPFRTSELMKKIREFTDLAWETVDKSDDSDLHLPDEAEEIEEEAMSIDADSYEKFSNALKIKNLTALKTIAKELEESGDSEAASAGRELARLAGSFDFAGLEALAKKLEC